MVETKWLGVKRSKLRRTLFLSNYRAHCFSKDKYFQEHFSVLIGVVGFVNCSAGQILNSTFKLDPLSHRLDYNVMNIFYLCSWSTILQYIESRCADSVRLCTAPPTDVLWDTWVRPQCHVTWRMPLTKAMGCVSNKNEPIINLCVIIVIEFSWQIVVKRSAVHYITIDMSLAKMTHRGRPAKRRMAANWLVECGGVK